MYKVKNTIDNTTELFKTLQEVDDHIKREIKWFNSLRENEEYNGYTIYDFNITEIKYVICDPTSNTYKIYIAEDTSNTGDILSAWLFDTKEEALNTIINSGWLAWGAYIEEVEI